MDNREIKLIWTRLLIPFAIGICLILFALYKFFIVADRTSQVRSYFIALLGVLLVVFAGKKILLFKKHLRDQK